MSNILYARFCAGRRCVQTEALYQYNYGQRLKITGLTLPETYEVHFGVSKAGDTMLAIGDATGVLIPDACLLSVQTVYAWLYLHTGEDDGETEFEISIPVKARGKLPNESPPPPSPPLVRTRVTSLDGTPLASDPVIEAVNIPEYVSDVSAYSAYGLTETGWYVFARVTPKAGTVVASPVVSGAAGYAIYPDYVDVAVRFDVAAQSVPVTINWGPYSETFVFKATDLAVRNLDYRTTFYVYDISPYAVWAYALTTDAAFVAGNHYYTENDGVYTEAVEGVDWTAGETVPAETYYKHSKLTFSGMVKNVTYSLNTPVDCAMEIVLPEIAEDGHGAWFEFQLRHTGSSSVTLTPPEGVKGSTAGASAAITAGLNVVDLHYTNVDGVKLWTLANVHTNIPA